MLGGFVCLSSIIFNNKDQIQGQFPSIMPWFVAYNAVPMIEDDGYMSNWSNNHEIDGFRHCQPNSISDLQALLSFARLNNYQIKICGKGLSPNGCGFRYTVASDNLKGGEGKEEGEVIVCNLGFMNSILNLDLLNKTVFREKKYL